MLFELIRTQEFISPIPGEVNLIVEQVALPKSIQTPYIIR
jgi:hypothetical protein